MYSLNVIFDISILGMGHQDSKARTGIFRVAENLMDRLLERDDLSLGLSAFTAPDSCLEYLAARGLTGTVSLQYDSLLVRLLQERRQIKDRQMTRSGVRRALGKGYLEIVRMLVRHLERRPLATTGGISEADIVHSPYLPLPRQIGSLKAKKFITLYDLIPVLLPEYFRHSGHMTEILRSIDEETWILCISEATKHDFCTYRNMQGFDPAKLFVTPLAASGSFFPCHDAHAFSRVREKYGLPETPYLLSICSLEPRKNLVHVVRSFAALINQEHLSDLSLVLVGPHGWGYEDIFAEICNNEAVRQRVIVTGYVADEDLAAVYSGALAFVYMSLYEGFGLPPLEAMQCGVPVITSNTTSLPEVVGDAGIALSPHDGDGLAQALYDVYSRRDYREELSAKSLHRAQRFSWDACADATVAAYRTALQSAGH